MVGQRNVVELAEDTTPDRIRDIKLEEHWPQFLEEERCPYGIVLTLGGRAETKTIDEGSVFACECPPSALTSKPVDLIMHQEEAGATIRWQYLKKRRELLPVDNKE
jgi:hypothetical protein